jgi:hypothetical protein
MQKQLHPMNVWILVQMIDPSCIEGARSPDNPVNLVALG